MAASFPTADAEYQDCPFCLERIRKGARKCKHCGEFLELPPHMPGVASAPPAVPASVAFLGVASVAAEAVLDLLSALVDKSLVVYDVDAGTGQARAAPSGGRYRLLETVRQYADQRLTESGEGDALRERHRNWCVALAEEAGPHLRGPQQLQWMNRLESEHENLRAALDGCVDSEGARGAAQEGLRLGAALWWFWYVRGHMTEGRERLAALLASPGGREPTKARADVLNAAGNLATDQGDYTTACSYIEQSLALRRERGDRQGVAASLNSLGIVATHQGDYRSARSRYEESLAVYRELGNTGSVANTLNNLGSVASMQGDYQAARSLIEESLALRREAGNRQGIAGALVSLGILAAHQGDPAAPALFEEGLTLHRELGDKKGVAGSLINLGAWTYRQGDFAAARSRYEEGLTVCRELGDKKAIALVLVSLGPLLMKQDDFVGARACLAEYLSVWRETGDKRTATFGLEGCAELSYHQRQPERAARLFGAAHALREAVGYPLSGSDRDEHAEHLARVKALLGREPFESAFAAGQQMGFEQAMTEAREGEYAGPAPVRKSHE